MVFNNYYVVNILNGTCLSTINAVASFTIGIIGSLVSGIIGSYYCDYSGTLFLIGFITSYGLADVLSEIFKSATIILLMCICEDTSIIFNRVPLLESFIRERYSAQCSDLFANREQTE